MRNKGAISIKLEPFNEAKNQFKRFYMHISSIINNSGILIFFSVALLASCAEVNTNKSSAPAEQAGWVVRYPAQFQPGCRVPDTPNLPSVNGIMFDADIAVDLEGKPSLSKVVQSAGSESIDALIIKQIFECKFYPATEIKYFSGGKSEKNNVIGVIKFKYEPKPVRPLGFGKCFLPAYPEIAKRLGEQGVATVKFRVNSKDDQVETVIAESSNFPRLDEASENFIKNCVSFSDVKKDFVKNVWLEKRMRWFVSG